MASQLDDAILVMTSCPSQQVGLDIGRRLVTDGLAACVQLGSPSVSLYRWQGKLCEDTEFPLFIKTRQARYSEVEQAILAQHPYELPEIIALPISHALPGYLNWIKDNTEL
ncbi:divalent-cation tolerance protein CutA [Shewanella sp. JM162201]|uniref:Divalent-cation tolerance protein CutA n=1 Tax=Shewanella jiangmenensis TaxID=2837387 RepID=A0ABS5V3L0_9GAMM|nr:divalent-cation tolerance protein CutA [Shewanella jiangmenensis]MBT1444211.1 divalent-cation tolerance protein CutA [Shewanella jiangmenensis]